MAEKEATVFIIDLGQTMGQKHQGRKQSDLDWAMTYVWEKITSIMALDRKTTYQGVLGLRTDGTRNEYDEQDGFQHISVLMELLNFNVATLKNLQSRISLSKTNDGDAISSIVLAIQMISTFCKHLKYKKKILVVTDARGSIDGEDNQQIVEKLSKEGIELVVIGVDFDDPDYGFKEEDKDSEKAANEKVLQDLVEGCGGIFGTMAQAVEELGEPRLKYTRPVPNFKGHLTLGNPDDYDSAIVIDVERYPKVMIRRPLTASSFVQRSDSSDGENPPLPSEAIRPDASGKAETASKSLATIHSERSYHVVDDTSAGGKREVSRDDLAKGYEYGRTAVHISESDLNVTKLETTAGLEIIGFIPTSNYPRYFNMSSSYMVIPQKTNTKAILALSSLIHTLHELESYAVARLVTKDGREPEIRLLTPSIEPDFECLLDVQLPFIEDVRPYKFPPLDRVMTVSGKKITEHRNLPSGSLQKAMNGYVDGMDLSGLERDEDGNPVEYLQMTDAFSPIIHRIDQAVRWRAVHVNEPIPPPAEILIKYTKPPSKLVEQSKPQLEGLVSVADVKKVPPKTQARKRTRNEVKPLSGLDVGALLASKSKKARISKENAIPEFRQAIDNSESPESIKDAAKQLGAIIEAQIKDSFADQAYQAALEKLSAFRQEMIDVDEPDEYNKFVKGLKARLLGEALNGDRREMWWLIKQQKLGLISKKTSEISSIDDDEANEFLSSR